MLQHVHRRYPLLDVADGDDLRLRARLARRLHPEPDDGRRREGGDFDRDRRLSTSPITRPSRSTGTDDWAARDQVTSAARIATSTTCDPDAVASSGIRWTVDRRLGVRRSSRLRRAHLGRELLLASGLERRHGGGRRAGVRGRRHDECFTVDPVTPTLTPRGLHQRPVVVGVNTISDTAELLGTANQPGSGGPSELTRSIRLPPAIQRIAQSPGSSSRRTIADTCTRCQHVSRRERRQDLPTVCRMTLTTSCFVTQSATTCGSRPTRAIAPTRTRPPRQLLRRPD